ncbi:squalene/phytoene synthase family protein [Acaricomes phytoseiuli]|uniref:phytoene/squalene synthase family protein n=1 Tax=Acaricomes phytoseiuli TaxID=291968 RepID=UPI000378333A|nr:squalene/phytoene synthase family protein [Acaricomes phytoseiuli]MCW1248674.1 squalene/phytoene synthase family protein [Acaricomes phytoseiuli]
MTLESADAPGALSRYEHIARESSTQVIRRYSTSFRLASALLGKSRKADIASIYGLVRIADEIVDGAAAQAGLEQPEITSILDELEAQTLAALDRGYSSNLLVHAFADTARKNAIDAALVRPFFASMRRDTDPSPFDEEQVRDYIYGSAEVVGLMCLRVFLRGVGPAEVEAGARSLGSAFQKVNFLRDFHQDWYALGRNYFPWLDPQDFGEAQKQRITADITADLDAAAAVIPQLPVSSRYAVAVAHGVFAELNTRLERTAAAQIMQSRIRVPDPVKLLSAGRSIIRLRPWQDLPRRSSS